MTARFRRACEQMATVFFNLQELSQCCELLAGDQVLPAPHIDGFLGVMKGKDILYPSGKISLPFLPEPGG